MVTVYSAPSLWGLPSISPACMKLETWLRMTQIPHTVVRDVDMTQAPKGKLPFIDYNGTFLGDSSLIINLLKRQFNVDPEQALTPTEQAIALAFQRMLEENTYWAIAYIRYGIEKNWLLYQEVVANWLFPGSPQEVWQPVMEGLRENFQKQLYCQGMGRHSEAEICQIARADFQALSNFLADKPFLMGDKPTTVDTALYGQVGNVIHPPYPSAIVDSVLELTNLCDHYTRMTEMFFAPHKPQ